MAKFINLTPHEIKLVGENNEVKLVVEPSGQVARLSAKTVVIGDIDGIPLTTTEFGELEGLPEPEEGTLYIVSQLVAQQVPERQDVVIPNESVRDDKGRIIGCRSLGRVPNPMIGKRVHVNVGVVLDGSFPFPSLQLFSSAIVADENKWKGDGSYIEVLTIEK